MAAGYNLYVYSCQQGSVSFVVSPSYSMRSYMMVVGLFQFVPVILLTGSVVLYVF